MSHSHAAHGDLELMQRVEAVVPGRGTWMAKGDEIGETATVWRRIARAAEAVAGCPVA